MGYYTTYYGELTITPAIPKPVIRNFITNAKLGAFDDEIKTPNPFVWYGFRFFERSGSTIISHEGESGKWYYTKEWFQILAKYLSDHRNDPTIETFGWVEPEHWEIEGGIEWTGEDADDHGRLTLDFEPNVGFVPHVEKGVITYVREE